MDPEQNQDTNVFPSLLWFGYKVSLSGWAVGVVTVVFDAGEMVRCGRSLEAPEGPKGVLI